MQNGDCKDSPEAVPNKAFVISLPGDVAKRDVLISVLTDLGLHVEHVEGVLSDQVCHHTKPPDSARAFTSTTVIAGLKGHAVALRTFYTRQGLPPDHNSGEQCC